MKGRLTKAAVEAATSRDRDFYLWDDRTPGFGAKITPGGARIYVLKYRARGAQRWIRIARHGDLTVDQARARAIELRGRIAGGEDPAVERDSANADITLDTLGERYLAEYAVPHKKPRSVEEDRRNLAKHVRPALGHLKATAVARQDVLRLHHKMRATPGAANRVVALLSKMLSLAEEWGVRPSGNNPASKIRKFKETSRERFLSSDELSRLGGALADAASKGEHTAEIGIIRLLLLTGARLSEISTLQWSYVDFERGSARLPDSKSGAKTLRLGAPALDVLAEIPRTHDLVFPDKHGKPIYRSRIERVWWAIRSAAGLDDVKLHDTRHTFASWGAMGGASLPMLGALLGHRQAATTSRYAHLRDDPVHEVAEAVSSTLAAALSGKAADIVELPDGRRIK